ncbi:uncharacterized protein LOC113325103 [Papaver somniferum]|uniref:uncharacterized protein LOC113325103 n=1 Tax=Papaver somniferum TaxID=3469 RepID=UPI000E6FE7BE|nr:uncharacterized protein LOC113325103 [Papaver somniferum]
MFGNIHSNIALLHQKLEVVQASIPNQDTGAQVEELEHQIEHWHQIQSEFWGQKARDEYFLEMDRNTRFHHANTNRRRSRNNISALKDESGSWCTTRNDMESILVNDYNKLHTTISPAKNENILQCIPKVTTAAENLELTRIPEDAEIIQALKSMKPWKAPGPDGFPPGFF